MAFVFEDQPQTNTPRFVFEDDPPKGERFVFEDEEYRPWEHPTREAIVPALKETAKDIGRGIETGLELGQQFATAAPSFVAGIGAGAGALLSGKGRNAATEAREEATREVSQFFNPSGEYSPLTEKVAPIVGKPFEIPGTVARSIGDFISATGELQAQQASNLQKNKNALVAGESPEQIKKRWDTIAGTADLAIEVGIFALAPELAKKGWVKGKGIIENIKTKEVMPPREVAQNIMSGKIKLGEQVDIVKGAGLEKPKTEPKPITPGKPVLNEKLLRQQADKLGIEFGGIWPDKKMGEFRAPGMGNFTVDFSKGQTIEGEMAKTRKLFEEKGKPAPKQPWQMTREEYKKLAQFQTTGPDIRVHTPGGKTTLSPNSRSIEVALDRSHKNDIQQALSEGKPVPPEVLKDYNDLVDRYKNEFVKSEGSFDLGIIGENIEKEIGIPSAPIRMQIGNKDFGAVHIASAKDGRRLSSFKEAGYSGVNDFVKDVVQNYKQIWQQPNGRLMLVKRNGKAKLSVVELSESADYYGVSTALIADNGYPARGGRKLLWERSEPVSARPGQPGPLTNTTPFEAQKGDAWRSGQSNINITQKTNDVNKNYPRIEESPQPLYRKAEAVALPEVREGVYEQYPVTKRTEIINQMKKVFDIPVRHGKTQIRTAAGIYKPKQEVVRLKRAGDVETAMHELGHHLDRMMELPKGMPGEIMNMAYVGAKNKSREGFAEFFRTYITRPEVARTEAPTFYKYFEYQLKNYPDINDVVLQAREAWKTLNAAPSVVRVGSAIQYGKIGEPRKGIIGTLKELYRETVDDLFPMKDARKKVEKKLGHQLKATENFELQARMFRGWPRQAMQFLQYQTFRLTPEGVKFTGPGLAKILEKVENNGDLKLLDTLLFAKRAANDPRLIEGFKGIIDKADFEQTIKDLEPRFQKELEQIYQYSDQVLQFLVDSERMNQGVANAIRARNLFYAPLYRVMDSSIDIGPKAGGTFGNLFNPIKKLKGSSRDVYSPVENLIYNTFTFINIGARNRVGKALIDISKQDGMGWLIEKVPQNKIPVKINAGELRNEFAKYLGKESDALFGQLFDALQEAGMPEKLTFFKPSSFQPKPNELVLYRKGEPALYHLDENVYKAFMNLDHDTLSMVEKVLSAPARLLRVAATSMSPEFPIRNPFRDQLTAFIQSKYGYKPFYDGIEGALHVIKKDELWQKYNASGAAHSALVSLDREFLSKTREEILKHDKGLQYFAKHPIESWRILSEIGEEVTRIGEFKRGIKKEGETLEGLLKAGYAAKEVSINFSQRGAQTRALNSIVAFFNANVQGVDKLIRTFSSPATAPKALFNTFVGITIPSLLLWSYNKDDPYYQELPPWRKVACWNFIIHNDDGTLKRVISLPKPWQLGILFGSLPETVLDYLHTKDPDAFKDVAKQLGEVTIPNFIPTAAAPVAEWAANKSFYFGHPLVPRGKEELEPELQYGPHTSETVKLLAQGMAKVPGLKEFASPAKIQNLIYGYTGGAGRGALTGLDYLIEKLDIKGVPSSPARTMADIPGIRAFVANFPSADTASIKEFYDKYGKLRRGWESKKQRMGVRGTGLEVNKPVLLQQYDATNKILGFLRKTADNVYLSRTMDPETKRQRLNQTYFAMINVSRATLGKKPINFSGKEKNQ